MHATETDREMRDTNVAYIDDDDRQYAQHANKQQINTLSDCDLAMKERQEDR